MCLYLNIMPSTVPVFLVALISQHFVSDLVHRVYDYIGDICFERKRLVKDMFHSFISILCQIQDNLIELNIILEQVQVNDGIITIQIRSLLVLHLIVVECYLIF